MDECLQYFSQAILDPLSVPAWSEWWAANEEFVKRAFPHLEYVRLKHRRLRGAREILQKSGILSEDFKPISVLKTGSCSECGDRTTNSPSGPGGGAVICPNCGIVSVYDFRPPQLEPTLPEPEE